MNKKRIVSMALALVLAVGAGVGGTLAYLQAKTEPVINTFVAGKIIDNPETDFLLKEHLAVEQEDGTYQLDESQEVDANAYTVLPGAALPKDPFVRVKPAEEAYLYVEVVNNLPAGMTATVDAAKWQKLRVEGVNGGTVYAYTGTLNVGTENTVSILEGNHVTVGSDFTADQMAKVELQFYAYLAQKTNNGTDAASAWNNTFGA